MVIRSVKNHDLHRIAPPADLRAWLDEQAGLFPASLAFSGQSLKYFRNSLPVATLLVDGPELAALRAAFPAGDAVRADDALLAVRHGRGEVKLILDLPGTAADSSSRGGLRLPPREFHVLVHDRQWAAGGAYLSLDRLEAAVFGAAAGRWDGAAEDLADLGAGRLRALGLDRLDTRDAFRCGALASMTDFELEGQTRERLAETYLPEAAAELDPRFMQKQFRKLVLGLRPSRGFETLRELGALDGLLPELAAGLGLAQNRYHKHDIYYHSIFACDSAEPELALRLAALFHDLGKVDTRKEHENGEASFHNHEIVSTRHTENIMRRLQFPGALKKRVKFLVRNHMFHYTEAWSDRAVRRFMKRVSTDQLEDLISLRLADRKGSGKRSELPRAIKELMRHIGEIRAQEAELKIKDLAIDGHRLMELGLRPGPEMGRVLRDLLEAVKAGNLGNDAESLEAEARGMLAGAVSTS